MLVLVGIGLEEGDLTEKAKEAIEQADFVFTEAYTSKPWRVFGELLEREKVESDFLLELARNKKVVLCVPGDPLFATTHISLVLEAKKQGIEVRVIHAPSVINAVARTGLSPYKFGRIITISGDFESDKERVFRNLDADLHTLCLIDPKMHVKEALEILRKWGVRKAVVCSCLGTKKELIRYGEIEKLLNTELGSMPWCIIVPAKLHFFEEEFLQLFKM